MSGCLNVCGGRVTGERVQESGGSGNDWTADGILDERVYKSIGRYACARLRLAGSCVEISPGKAFKMRKFYKCIVTSEKSTLS